MRGGVDIKLNMWMIANCLRGMEPQINISPDAPAVLRSARRASATDCVIVMKDGDGVICTGTGGTIRLFGISEIQACEIIQHVFDFHSDWEDTIIAAFKANRSFQEVIDLSYRIFRNPMIISDINFRVHGITRSYGINDVDAEWRCLCETGCHSLKAAKSISELQKRRSIESANGAFCLNVSMPNTRYSRLCMELVSSGNSIGRIMVVEKDHQFNPGDYKLLEHLAHLISEYTSLDESQTLQCRYGNILADLIESGSVQKGDLDRLVEYAGWASGSQLRAYVIAWNGDTSALSRQYAMNLVQSALPDAVIFPYNDEIVAVADDEQNPLNELKTKLRAKMKADTMCVGVSLCFEDISSIGNYYQQARFALEFSRNLAQRGNVAEFYNYGVINFISSPLGDNSAENCHPDVRRLWELSKERGTEDILTLRQYLLNDRNLVKAAQTLYIHRNTLIYRLKRIEEQFEHSLDDPYTRQYMLISLLALELLGGNTDIEGKVNVIN